MAEIVLSLVGGEELWRTVPWTVLAVGFVISCGAEEPLAALRHLGKVHEQGGSPWDALWRRSASDV